MSGIAEVLLKQGYKISGSDLISTNITKRLIALGAKIYFNHSKKNIKNANIIVMSNAISSHNPEITHANILKIPVIKRGEMLAEITRYKYGIAVSGTHGKTTTTALIFSILLESNLDPTLINGGLVKSINNSAKLGNSPYYIIEADESDASFLYLTPVVSILTNIDNDHLENYHENFDNIKSAFIKFVQNIPSYGTAIICIDDKNIRKIISSINCNIITYGFSTDSDVRIEKYTQNKFSSHFVITRPYKPQLDIILNMPGIHNALNATAAIATATQENINDVNILKSLKNFKGIERRFELCGNFLIKKSPNIYNVITIIKDYGHHPKEISSSINTARSGWPKTKLLMIFQPHKYTRTYYLFEQFKNVLLKVDELFILKVYPANEHAIPGTDSLTLYNELCKYKKKSITLISNYNDMFTILIKKLSRNNILLIQGAGNVDIIVDNHVIKNFKKLNKKQFLCSKK
ncbi:MAG: UDP-N-acetylmuramate--L-alanine ligase [Buchnera aphidicola (Meitanaphis elongallis)]